MGDLPPHLLDMIMREFVPYSVALARIKDETASTFTPLGSGTLVHRNGRFGIMTAHHCLHACKPQVRLGVVGGDTLLLVLRGGRSLVVQSERLLEHPLAIPTTDEFGPDLTFIEILPTGSLDSCKAIGSFWSLNGDTEVVLREFGNPKTPLASTGFPQADYKTEIKGNDIHHKVKHMAYIGVIEPQDLVQRSGWDYLETEFNYDECNELPESFCGMSGGGIWGMQLRKHKDGNITIEKSALIGVTFYQTERQTNQRQVRAHFIRSIYDLAWRDTDTA